MSWESQSNKKAYKPPWYRRTNRDNADTKYYQQEDEHTRRRGDQYSTLMGERQYGDQPSLAAHVPGPASDSVPASVKLRHKVPVFEFLEHSGFPYCHVYPHNKHSLVLPSYLSRMDRLFFEKYAHYIKLSPLGIIKQGKWCIHNIRDQSPSLGQRQTHSKHSIKLCVIHKLMTE